MFEVKSSLSLKSKTTIINNTAFTFLLFKFNSEQSVPLRFLRGFLPLELPLALELPLEHPLELTWFFIHGIAADYFSVYSP